MLKLILAHLWPEVADWWEGESQRCEASIVAHEVDSDRGSALPEMHHSSATLGCVPYSAAGFLACTLLALIKNRALRQSKRRRRIYGVGAHQRSIAHSLHEIP